MSKSKKIQKFIKGELNEMRENLDSLCLEWNNEKLHDLRLNSKKTKAVVSLLKSCSSNKKKLSIKKLKELFDHAGKIRTAHLNVEALHENNVKNEGFEKEQNLIFERETAELCKKKKDYNRDIKRLKKSMSSLSAKIKTSEIKLYYYENVEKLRCDFSTPIKEDALHDSRKIIKNLLLALKALPKSLQGELRINKKYLDDLQDKIGKWHDVIVTLQMLPVDDGNHQSLVDKKQAQFVEIKNMAEVFNEKAIVG